MPHYSTLERLQVKVLDAAASLVMAPTTQRSVYDQFTMTVARTADLAPRVRRVTFHAEEFGDYVHTGPDECFGLLMPPPGAGGLTMPSADRINVRQAIRRLPEDRRPDLRWYTIRRLRRAEREIDVDFVLHGDEGPGSRWASRAEAGQEVGFRAGSATYRPTHDGPRLLAADETALPALSAILETHRGDPDVRAFVEVPDEDHRLPIATDVPVTWLFRGGDAPGSRLVPAVRDADTTGLGYAWLCGESALATGLRRHLVKDRGVDRRRILFSGYWRVGAARE
jgi:NADPH-dependent ferric siderophore reductase